MCLYLLELRLRPLESSFCPAAPLLELRSSFERTSQLSPQAVDLASSASCHSLLQIAESLEILPLVLRQKLVGR